MKALIPTEQRCESMLDKAYMNSLELNLIALSYYLLDKKSFTPQETKEAVDYIFEFCDSMRVNGISISEIKAELEKDYGFAVRRKGHILSVGIKKKEEEV